MEKKKYIAPTIEIIAKWNNGNLLDFVVGSVFDDSGDVDAKENLFEEDELDLDWKESNIDMWQWDYSNS